MERVISPEERIKRAEEIYYRRRSQGVRLTTTSVNRGRKNKISLTKKMIIQIIICFFIYGSFFMIKSNNNVFSENVINHTRNILNYDVNFFNMYNQFKEYFNNNFNSIIKKQDDINENVAGENIVVQDNIEIVPDDASESTKEEEPEIVKEEETENDENKSEGIGGGSEIIQNSITEGDGTQKAKMDYENLTQMQEDAEFVKQNYNLIKPVEGNITSKFGGREETEIISAFHQGIDIGAVTGTVINAAMEGEVVAASYAGDYGNHIKIKNGEILTVYAHCSKLNVKVGDYVVQGQEIGNVGATGKVTRTTLAF